MDALRKEGNSIGARINVIARNVPPGLGEPIFDRLDAEIAHAMMSINAVKGVEIGAGFDAVTQKGTEHRDEITPEGFLSNNAGGVLGGISSGQDILVSMALKATSSLRLPGRSVDTEGNAIEVVTHGRHDPCVGIRATPIAEAMLAILHDEKPEALIDIHNTSGSGPSFAVTITNDTKHRALTSLFTQRLIHTDLRLGAIMEFSENDVPTVTIECGGAQDDEAHELAYEGIKRFTSEDNVLTEQETDWGLELLENPIRIELKEDVTIAFAEKAKVDTDITLPPSIENHNFGIILPDQPLGWLGERGLACFVVKNTLGEDKLSKVLREEAGVLYVAQPIRAFMITTNADIAKSDCLFYAVADHGGAIS